MDLVVAAPIPLLQALVSPSLLPPLLVRLAQALPAEKEKEKEKVDLVVVVLVPHPQVLPPQKHQHLVHQAIAVEGNVEETALVNI
ncbi:hypothetical protein HNR27_001831 [Ornithinibacillus bavariensis]